MYIPRSLIRTAVLLAAAVLLTGCSLLKIVGIGGDSPPPLPPPPEIPLAQQPYTLKLSIDGSVNMNINSRNQPSPVRVRVFLTEPDKDLMSQPFETIFEFDGSSPVVKPREVVVVAPGQSRTLELSAMKSQNQLIVAAAFHDVHSTTWIANKTIDTDNPDGNSVAIGRISVEIQ